VSNHFDQFLGESGLADFPQLLHVSEEKLKRKEAWVFLRRGRAGLDALYVSQPTVSKH